MEIKIIWNWKDVEKLNKITIEVIKELELEDFLKVNKMLINVILELKLKVFVSFVSEFCHSGLWSCALHYDLNVQARVKVVNYTSSKL